MQLFTNYVKRELRKNGIAVYNIEVWATNEKFIIFKIVNDNKFKKNKYYLYERHSCPNFKEGLIYKLIECNKYDNGKLIINKRYNLICYNQQILGLGENNRIHDIDEKNHLVECFTYGEGVKVKDFRLNLEYNNVRNFYTYSKCSVIEEDLINGNDELIGILQTYYTKNKEKYNIKVINNQIEVNNKTIPFKIDFKKMIITKMIYLNKKFIYFIIYNNEKHEEELHYCDIEEMKIKKLATSKRRFSFSINFYENIQTVQIARGNLIYNGKKFDKENRFIELYGLIPCTEKRISFIFNNEIIETGRISLFIGKTKVFIDKYNLTFDSLNNNLISNLYYVINKEELIIDYYKEEIFTVSNSRGIIYGQKSKLDIIVKKDYYSYDEVLKKNIYLYGENFSLKRFILELKLTNKRLEL